MVTRNEDLGTHRGRMIDEQGKDGVGGRGGNDLQLAVLLKFSEGAYDIAAVRMVGFAQGIETMVIYPGEGLVMLVPACAVNLPLGELNEGAQMSLVPALEEWIQEHRA